MATINISSDSDDDSVIVIPYTKPKPPTIVLVDSDHEERLAGEPKPTVKEKTVQVVDTPKNITSGRVAATLKLLPPKGKPKGTPKVTPKVKSGFRYTLTPAQKKQYPHLEKILMDLQKEKERKRAQEERLKQFKNPQKSTNSNQASSSSKSTPKKRTKKDINAALLAADLDHLSFLKTLNLTAGIGFNEKELEALGNLTKNKSTRKKRTKNLATATTSTSTVSTLSSSTTSTPTVPTLAVSTVQETESLLNTTSASKNTFVQQPSVSSNKEIIIDSIPSSSKSITPQPSFSVPAPFVSIIDESLGKNSKNRRKQDKPVTTASPLVVASQPEKQVQDVDIEIVEIPSTPPKKVVRNVNSGGNVSTEVEDHEDDDCEGIFTQKEIRELQSNIQLNITGPNGSISSLRSQSKDDSRNKTKRFNVRYFDNPNTSGGNESLSDVSSESEEDFKSPGPSSHSQNAQKRHKRKLNKNQDESSPNSKKRKRTNDKNNSPLFDGSNADLAKIAPSARSFPKTWTSNMIKFYGTTWGENLDLNQVWDKQSNSPRSWSTPLDPGYRRRNGKQFKCTNCNQFGNHPARLCPEPRRPKICIMCGHEGHTTSCLYENNNQTDSGKSKQLGRFTVTRCPQANCLNCGRYVFNNKTSSAKSFTNFCDRCTAPTATFRRCRNCGCEGHTDFNCYHPDNWRRFHSTLVDSDAIPANSNEELQKTVYKHKDECYCSNCGQKGHLYFYCRGRRDYNVYAPSKPFIIRELPLSLKTQSSAIVQESIKNSITTSVFSEQRSKRSVRRHKEAVFEVQVTFDSTDKLKSSNQVEPKSSNTTDCLGTVSGARSSSSGNKSQDEDIIIVADADTTTTNSCDITMEEEKRTQFRSFHCC